jgi:23S rRNA pseudouridine955/2504/2580 synthase
MTDASATGKPGVTFFEVTEAQDGQRVDNFLHRHLKGVPKSKVYRILRKGEVRVNKSRVKPEYKLAIGDLIRIPPVRVDAKSAPAKVSTGLNELLEASVLYEDDQLLIINKPSGLAVHGGSGINLGLIEALRVIRPDERSLELVHRLDRETSGCVMVAKKRSMLKYLHELLRRKGGVDKRYLALVSGRWPNRKKVVNAPLEKNHLQSGERMVRVTPEGKPSVTEFEVLERYSKATLVQAKPITGRTHQIRVHALHAGYPLLGDEKYCPAEDNRAFRDLGLRRLFLHAASLRLQLPEGGKKLVVEAPLEQSLQTVLAKLSPATEEKR